MSDQAVILVSDEDFESAALSLIAAKRSENTRTAYRVDLSHWMTFCRMAGEHPKSPSLVIATRFRDHTIAISSKGSARRAIAALSGIYRVLLAAGLARSNPFHSGVLAWPPETAVNRTERVSAEVADAMIQNAAEDPDSFRGKRDVAVLRFLYDTGLRRASIAALVRAHLRGGVMRAVIKGDKEVEITLPADTITALESWLVVAPESEFVFPGTDTKRSISPLTINKLVRERATAVGAKNVHPHCFRAAFITASYDAGLPEYEIQASVHHSNAKTTRRYDRGSRGKAVATQLAEFRKGKPKP